MAEKKLAPKVVRVRRVTNIEYDLVAGRLRYNARLNTKAPRSGIVAIWRNEVGNAQCTEPDTT